MKHLVSALVLLCSCLCAVAQEVPYTPSPEIRRSQEAFQDAKFGVFIHWGIYSMLARGEWVMHNINANYREYTHLADGFYPSKFDANEWVKAIADAGAKYITFTTRHHDGFSMFRTALSKYNIVDGTPFHRDVVGELAAACRKYGITLNLYYSHLDWQRTDYPLGTTGRGVGRPTNGQDYSSYLRFMEGQLTELLTQYGPIGAIWFDGYWDHNGENPPFDWHLREQYDLIHRLQPACLILNNHHLPPIPGEDLQGFEQDLPGENSKGLSGQSISRLPLETCLTMNNTWGYNLTDKNYKSSQELIQKLIRAAGKNANLLLNIGPRPDGMFPDEALERLRDIGAWLKANGSTIYSTRGGLVPPHDWGVTTQRGDTLFVHILQWPDRALYLPEVQTAKSARLFATGEKVAVSKATDGIVITLPEAPTGVDTIVEIVLK